MTAAADRRGFTLLEVVVALALTAVVALTAHGVLSAIIEASGRAAIAREANDRRMNGRQWLTTAVASIDVGRAGFEGTADSATFTAWLPVAEGWMTPERITILLTGDTLALRGAARTVALETGVESIRLDYLAEPGLAGAFMEGWNSPISAPQAVRLRITQVDPAAGIDTVFLVVGDRG
jgi:prepilin-type N-terminal cleavage/methylation domain-containing protein